MTAPTGPRPLWEIIGQVPQLVQDATGTYVPGVMVTFRTRSGQIGQVGIPEGQYTDAESIAAVVAARASLIESVQGMTG